MSPDIALRSAGLVLAVPFLLGLLPGSVAAPAIGVALIGFARTREARRTGLYSAAAVVVYIAAVALGAWRWESHDLEVVRGVQAVLGATVMVGPPAVAGAALAAAAAGVVSLALWLGAPDPPELWSAEAATGSLLLVTVFWGPALPGLGSAGALARGALWVVLTVAVAAAAASLGTWAGERSPRARWGVLGAAAAATGGAFAALASAV